MPSRPLLVDAHQDLAWNMLTFGRDYTQLLVDIRSRDEGTIAVEHNGHTLLGWDAFQRGRVAVVFATLFAAPLRSKHGDWETQSYRDAEQAHGIYRAQLEAYHRLADDHPDRFTLIFNRSDLEKVLDQWEQPLPEGAPGCPVGLIVLMEGAEGVRDVAELEDWWQLGVRLIGPAWMGTRFCGGSKEPGPLTKEGYALLEAMSAFAFTLDLSHMDQQAALQALDAYPGQIVATHANAAALLKGTDSNRHLPDRVIQGIIARDGLIGVVPYNKFLQVGWKRGDARELVPLSQVAEQIDYICQLAGDSLHVGIGSDFDGGFGLDSVPADVEDIADLHALAPLLAEKGYSEEDIAAVLGDNWLRMLQETLP